TAAFPARGSGLPMSTAVLSDRPKTQLASLARRRGVRGSETMTKEALIKALSRSDPAAQATPATSARPARAASPAKPAQAVPKARAILAVRAPYWLHVWWDISPASVQRAEAALRQDWYGAKRVIRLFDVTSQDTTSTSETPVRNIPIEGDGQDWYINVAQPPR